MKMIYIVKRIRQGRFSFVKIQGHLSVRFGGMSDQKALTAPEIRVKLEAYSVKYAISNFHNTGKLMRFAFVRHVCRLKSRPQKEQPPFSVMGK